MSAVKSIVNVLAECEHGLEETNNLRSEAGLDSMGLSDWIRFFKGVDSPEMEAFHAYHEMKRGLPFTVTLERAVESGNTFKLVAEFANPDDMYDFRADQAGYFAPCKVTVTEFGKVTREYECTGEGEE